MGSGFVQSLSRPGGNATGFMMFEYTLCGKWPELLKEIAPSVTHAAVLRDPTFVAGIGQFAVIQASPMIHSPMMGKQMPKCWERDAAKCVSYSNGSNDVSIE